MRNKKLILFLISNKSKEIIFLITQTEENLISSLEMFYDISKFDHEAIIILRITRKKLKTVNFFWSVA